MFSSTIITKKEMVRLTMQTPNSTKVKHLIRAAAWIRQRGEVREISEDPVPEETIGILLNILRRDKNISLEDLQNRSGIPVEELIAFEAGMMPRKKIIKILPDLIRALGISSKKSIRNCTSQ